MTRPPVLPGVKNLFSPRVSFRNLEWGTRAAGIISLCFLGTVASRKLISIKYQTKIF